MLISISARKYLSKEDIADLCVGKGYQLKRLNRRVNLADIESRKRYSIYKGKKLLGSLRPVTDAHWEFVKVYNGRIDL